MSYKIQNRTAISQRIKVIKRADGTVTFPGSPTPTFQENTMQAGWCMTPIPEIPEYQQPRIDFILSALPMGVNGRVSIYRNGTLASSMRFKDLNGSPAKVAWFNGQFGAVVELSMLNGGRVKFKSREGDNQIAITFEDDDIDFIAGNFRPDSDTYTAYFREHYRIGIAMEQTEIDCTGAIDWAGILTFNDQISGEVSDNVGSTPISNNDEMVAALRARDFTVVELEDWVPPVDGPSFGRIRLPMLSDMESETEPDNLKVTLKQKSKPEVTFTGLISSVMDKCQQYGILLFVDGYDLFCGTEPGTSFTTVEVKLVDANFNVSNIREEFGDAVTITSSGIKFNLAWDNMEEFNCAVSADVDVDLRVCYNDRMDFAMHDTFDAVHRRYDVREDYAPQCSTAINPAGCVVSNSLSEYATYWDELTLHRGAKMYNRNQGWDWGPIRPDGPVTAEGYVATASLWVEGAFAFGYAIPMEIVPE